MLVVFIASIEMKIKLVCMKCMYGWNVMKCTKWKSVIHALGKMLEDDMEIMAWLNDIILMVN